MNNSLFKTFQSPYHIVSLKSPRYKSVLKYLAVALLLLPVLFLVFKSFSMYLVGHAAVFVVLPLFLWMYLMSEQVTDVKLDVIKVFVILVVYFSYLTMLTWVMIRVFNPGFKYEYVLLSFGYIVLLGVVSVITVTAFFHHRYTQRVIERKKL